MTIRLRCLIVAVSLLSLSSVASPQYNSFPPGTFNNRAALSGGAAVGYQGPGNSVSGALAYWGLDGYTAAYTGNVINVCGPVSLTCVDMTVTAGQLNVTMPGGDDCTMVSCTIAIFYDQVGANNCSGSCDIAMAAHPVLTHNCPTTGHWCATWNPPMAGTTAGAMSATGPNTISYVANSTNTSATQTILYVGPLTGYNTSAAAGSNNTQLNNGSIITGTASDGAFHSIIDIVQPTGTNSTIYVDGSSAVAGDAGGTANLSTTAALGGAFSQVFSGTFCHLGLWPGALTGGNVTTMNSNQKLWACGGGF